MAVIFPTAVPSVFVSIADEVTELSWFSSAKKLSALLSSFGDDALCDTTSFMGIELGKKRKRLIQIIIRMHPIEAHKKSPAPLFSFKGITSPLYKYVGIRDVILTL